MSPVFYTLLLLLLPPSICSGQYFSPSPSPRGHHPHHHRSHLDTDPDLDLSPARPNYGQTTTRTTVRQWIHLPTVPSFPADLDYDDNSYDYNLVEGSGDAAGTELPTTEEAATEDDHELEYVDPFESDRNHFKSGSSEVMASWLLFLLPQMAALLLL